jgi:orotate phosphoribosyltransferase
MNNEKKIITELLRIGAVKVSPAQPFTWASGWKSPIYCDNRKTLSYPETRRIIRDGFVEIIRTHFSTVEVVAGVATGAIAMGALVAEGLDLPFIYVRPKPKDHGMENLIEGVLVPRKKVVIIEDLISTGGSSLKALQALKDAGAEVLGMAAIFTYGFEKATSSFKEAGCNLQTLGNYDQLISFAIEQGYVAIEQQELLAEWRKSPETWGQV